MLEDIVEKKRGFWEELMCVVIRWWQCCNGVEGEKGDLETALANGETEIRRGSSWNKWTEQLWSRN